MVDTCRSDLDVMHGLDFEKLCSAHGFSVAVPKSNLLCSCPDSQCHPPYVVVNKTEECSLDYVMKGATILNANVKHDPTSNTNELEVVLEYSPENVTVEHGISVQN